jgi:hypothetical protein
MSDAVKDYAVSRGMILARHVFDKKGNNSEIHMNEAELAALLAIAFEIGFEAGESIFNGE